jgi:hypothetical protein
MQRLEQAATQFVRAKQHGKEHPPLPSRTPERSAPERAGRHDSVAQQRYDRATTTPPSHVAIRRSIDAHIQQNMQREARRERIREVGQQVKQTTLTMARQIGRSVLGRQASPEKASPGRQQVMQAERGGKQRELTRAVRHEQAQTRQINQPMRQPPARQQQQRGKEQERGRSR